jgi:hypothetical protein
MGHEFDDPVLVDQAGRPRWSKALGWLSMVALAVLLFELTSDPALGGDGVREVRFSDIRVAHWLRGRPNRGRGRTCSWFYITRAIVHSCMAWIIIMMMKATVLVSGPGTAGPIGASSSLFVVDCCDGCPGSWMALAPCVAAFASGWTRQSRRP